MYRNLPLEALPPRGERVGNSLGLPPSDHNQKRGLARLYIFELTENSIAPALWRLRTTRPCRTRVLASPGGTISRPRSAATGSHAHNQLGQLMRERRSRPKAAFIRSGSFPP